MHEMVMFVERHPWGVPRGAGDGVQRVRSGVAVMHAVTAEEFAEAYRTFHRGDPPDRIEVGDQTWDDLDSELEALARPAEELAAVDRYTYDDAGDGFAGRCGTWLRAGQDRMSA